MRAAALHLASWSRLQRLNGDIAVGIDADVGGNIERTAHDGLSVERPICECAGGGKRIIAARTNADNAGFGLEHITSSGQHQ